MRAAAVAAALALALGGCSVEREATALYAELTETARQQGGLRTERDPADAPFSNADLAANFERIVFFTEFTLRDGVLEAEERETSLLKWAGPVRYRLVGDAVEPADHGIYAALAGQLAEATGLDIAAAGADEPDNMLILILGREARREAASFLEEARIPNAGLIYRLRADDYAIPCAASVNVDGQSRAIVQALILVKAETAGLLRESCAHEEFAQALGPGNDSDAARPSIFNDDGEFALLTEHDALILRVLYDPRLRAGMRRAEAMPIARRIIEELRPEPSGS
jgi:hypothetical protein